MTVIPLKADTHRRGLARPLCAINGRREVGHLRKNGWGAGTGARRETDYSIPGRSRRTRGGVLRRSSNGGQAEQGCGITP
jgi:hypothetical protein